MDAKLFEQQHSTINRRSVWHYLIETPIGMINVVDYEQPDMSIKRFIYDGRHDKAKEKYKQICRGLVADKL